MTRIGSLFSGAGGLDLAVQAVFGGEVVWHSEIDKAASKVLAHRFPGVPNLGSITTINWASVEPVDVLCGGFPCQDVSAAGKRAGIKDGTRSGLWSVFADAIDELRPQWVVIENVRGLLSATAHRDMESDETDMGIGGRVPVLRAAGAVLGDLADLGYDAQWATVAAAAVGAPHRRERVFILASDAECGSGKGIAHTAGDSEADREGRQTVLAGRRGSGLADSSGYGWDEGRPESAGFVGGFDAAVRGDEPGGAFIVADSGGAAVGEPARGSLAEETRSQSGDRPGNSRGERTPRDGRQACVCGDRRIDHDWFANPDRFDDGGCRRCRCESFWPSGDEPGVALLPTPNAQDGNGGKAPRGGSPFHNTGTKRQVPLTDLPDLLPKPTTQDGANNGGPSQFQRNTLPLNAEVTLLPTPAASDATGGGSHPDSRVGHSRQLIDYALLDNTTAWGKYEPAIRRWESIVGPAPAPTEPNKNGNPRLSAAFSEWLMGWPAGWVTDPAIGISRNDQLRIVGNGVCPQQAAAALQYLLNPEVTS